MRVSHNRWLKHACNTSGCEDVLEIACANKYDCTDFTHSSDDVLWLRGSVC